MDLSIIVVSYNTRDLTLAALASATRSMADSGLAYEVMVVDNASPDGSAEAVRRAFPDVALIANAENRGFAAANNQGLAASSGRHVVLLNPDTEVLDDALAQLVRFLDEHSDAGACGPSLVYADGSFQHNAFRFPGLAQTFLDLVPLHWRVMESRFNGRYPRSAYERGRPFPIDHPLGACLMVRRQVMDQVGRLDEGYFMYVEEIDWCRRIKDAGWSIYCVPQARVVHHAGQSTGQFRDAMFVALWQSRLRYFDKYHGAAWRWAVRRVIRLGLWRAARRTRHGNLSGEELARRLAAYAQVRAWCDQ
ncbi:MAG: glycosyltransferase family 2 protein [Chloroflexi bacterium]|nr:glycosyltransferase family 2 protein [Chloroflexota bacterium]MBU1748223.1 glycosyltransferase family 2 protein [Chloroflexota bacterium]MBU1878389.1 glycosyltransferase family 2 protein [Chloroflexota bacterium]